jgi:hypothetical protein
MYFKIACGCKDIIDFDKRNSQTSAKKENRCCSSTSSRPIRKEEINHTHPRANLLCLHNFIFLSREIVFLALSDVNDNLVT